jgi:hypothetical protein
MWLSSSSRGNQPPLVAVVRQVTEVPLWPLSGATVGPPDPPKQAEVARRRFGAFPLVSGVFPDRPRPAETASDFFYSQGRRFDPCPAHLAGVVFGDEVRRLSEWYAATGTKSRYEVDPDEAQTRMESGIQVASD